MERRRAAKRKPILRGFSAAGERTRSVPILWGTRHRGAASGSLADSHLNLTVSRSKTGDRHASGIMAQTALDVARQDAEAWQPEAGDRDNGLAI